MPLIRAFRVKFLHVVVAAALCACLYGTGTSIKNAFDNKAVEVLSTALVGKIIVIDPGHGGLDAGSKGAGGAVEEDINLAVSKKLAEMLGQGGAAVILTRESDMWLADPEAANKKRSDLIKRVDIANKNNADIFVSIHVNSFIADRRQRGAQTFSQPGSEEGKKVSRHIQAELARVLGNTDRKPKEVDYFIKHAKMPAVIVETGFISNAAEEKLLMNPVYQTKVAFAIYCGLVKYFAGKEQEPGKQFS